MDDANSKLGCHLECLTMDAEDSVVRRCGGRGEPLVLLHPFSLCPQVWEPVLPRLKQHHRVIALGIPGHMGADPLPPDFDHTIEAAVDLLEAKLDELGISKAHIVGNSLGGWLGIELARRGRALSVVALAPGGGWEFGGKAHRRLMRKFQLTRRLLQIGGPASLLMAHTAFTRRIFLGDAVAKPELLSPLNAALFIKAAWRCASFAGILKALPRQPLSKPFARLPCPVRVVWGTEDRVLPLEGCSEHWHRVLPGADWQVLDGVGHVQMYDAPELVADTILEWTAYGRPSMEPPQPGERLAG
jgi:pimeloyl-ACP methyl ester carboxylesterase